MENYPSIILVPFVSWNNDSELQIREGIEDNSKTFFFCF